jgi:hypothetical protein
MQYIVLIFFEIFFVIVVKLFLFNVLNWVKNFPFFLKVEFFN